MRAAMTIDIGRQVIMTSLDGTGRTAIVTGGAQGIGAAITRQLLAIGANVLVVDIKESGRDFVTSLDNPNVAFIQADVSQDGAAEDFVRHAAERFGGLDMFVNNAAILGPLAPIKDIELHDLQAVLSVNLIGMFLGMRAAIRRMTSSGSGGSIVNIASLSAIRANPMRAGYNCAKAGVVSLTKTAAVEAAQDNIRVNAVIPTAVDTPMSKQVDQTRDQQGARMSIGARPMGRKAEPDEIAAMTLFLLSDAASFCTGGLYHVDGGASA